MRFAMRMPDCIVGVINKPARPAADFPKFDCRKEPFLNHDGIIGFDRNSAMKLSGWNWMHFDSMFFQPGNVLEYAVLAARALVISKVQRQDFHEPCSTFS